MLEVALVAAVCMLVTDIAGTVMVMAEATNRGWLAGWMDVFGYLFSITTTSISVAAVNGHDLEKKIVVLAFVSGANLFGTKLGQVIGHKITGTQPHTTGSVARRVADLEESMISKQDP